MPGVVSTLAVKAGQAVKAGDVLLSIEAMKMETALHAERDGTIAEVLVQAPATRSTPRTCWCVFSLNRVGQPSGARPLHFAVVSRDLLC